LLLANDKGYIRLDELNDVTVLNYCEHNVLLKKLSCVTELKG
jgi:hypothetical protein